MGTVDRAVALHHRYFASEGSDEAQLGGRDSGGGSGLRKNLMSSEAGELGHSGPPIDLRPYLPEDVPDSPAPGSLLGEIGGGRTEAGPPDIVPVRGSGAGAGEETGGGAYAWAAATESPPEQTPRPAPAHSPAFVPCDSDSFCQGLPSHGKHCFCKPELPTPAVTNPGYCACLVKAAGTAQPQSRGGVQAESRSLQDPAPPETPVLEHVLRNPSARGPRYPLSWNSLSPTALPPATNPRSATQGYSLWGSPARAEEAVADIVETSNRVQTFAKALSTGIVGLTGGTSSLTQSTLQHQAQMNDAVRKANPEETMAARAEESLTLLDDLGIPGLASAASAFMGALGVLPPETSSPVPPVAEAPEAQPPPEAPEAPQPPEAPETQPPPEAPAVQPLSEDP